LIIIHVLNSHFWRLLQCPPLFCCCLFLFDPDAIICHWWEIESKWLKKHMYGLPAVCQMVNLVCIDHNPCPKFTKIQMLQCPPLFCWCLCSFPYFWL
jgi:hypothetical protein